MSFKILVDKPSSMCDEEIKISITGLPCNSLVRVKAESSDYYCINALPKIGIGSIWSSEAVYRVNKSGIIDFSADCPISGDYNDASSMGLIYTMKPAEAIKDDRSLALSDIPIQESYHIVLSAYIGEELLCEEIIQRNYQNENIISTDIIKNNLVARLFRNENIKNQPAVIVLSGSDGRIEKAQNIAQILASHGYASLAIGYFGLDGTSSSLSHVPLEVIEEAIRFLEGYKNINPNKISIYGRSKGGELALLAGSRFNKISCVIANTPSLYIMEGLTTKNKNSKESSWAYKGVGIPYIPFRIMDFVPYIIKKVICKKDNLENVYFKMINRAKSDDARIAVENIKGDILFISSGNDEVWPSSLFAEMAMNRLEKCNFAYHYEHKKFENSGHHLTVAYQSNPRYPTQDWANCLSNSIESWNATIDFLDQWARK